MGVVSKQSAIISVEALNAAPQEIALANGADHIHLVITPLDANGDPIAPTGTPVTGTVTLKAIPAGSRYYQDILNQSDNNPVTITVGAVQTFPIVEAISKLQLTIGTPIAGCTNLEVVFARIG